MNSDVKDNLSYAYQILAHLDLDDHTYTHLSALAEDGESFYIYPFGMLFDEVTPKDLLRVSLNGTVLEGEELQYNKTGYMIHGSIYQGRRDIKAIFHVHTHATVAVSAMEAGLLPLSQWALHFYNSLAYHDYNSLVLDDDQGNTLLKDLGQYYVMFLRNHGVITSGRTLHEAMFYLYHLEQACKAQVLALSSGRELVMPKEETCAKAVLDLLNFEEDLGFRDWQAWRRLVDRKKLAIR